MLKEGSVIRATKLTYLGPDGLSGEIDLHDKQVALLVLGYETKCDDPCKWKDPIDLALKIGLYPIKTIPHWIAVRLKTIGLKRLQKGAIVDVAMRSGGNSRKPTAQKFSS